MDKERHFCLHNFNIINTVEKRVTYGHRQRPLICFSGGLHLVARTVPGRRTGQSPGSCRGPSAACRGITSRPLACAYSLHRLTLSARGKKGPTISDESLGGPGDLANSTNEHRRHLICAGLWMDARPLTLIELGKSKRQVKATQCRGPVALQIMSSSRTVATLRVWAV